MNNRWSYIWKTSKIIGVTALLLISIGFAEKRYGTRTCTSIDVSIDNEYENYFIDAQDVIAIATNHGTNRIIGTNLSELDLASIERNIKTNKFVRKVAVYKELDGTLSINVNQSRPIARLVSARGRDRYISDQGEVLPMSSRYTARVLLIDGPFAEHTVTGNLNTTNIGKQVMDLLHYIHDDPFWKAQIAQLYIDNSGQVKMYTQVSKQVIEFGEPEDFTEKFWKLKIFYKEILPAKGWNTYSRVSVKFKNQIVCE